MYILFFLTSILFSFSFSYTLQVNDLVFSENMSVGETRQIKIQLINDQNYQEDVHLKICDYRADQEGHQYYEEAGTLFRTNAPWIHLHTPRVLLEPREEKIVYLTMKVPNDTSLKGCYWSMLLIEPEKPVSFIPSGEQDNQGIVVKIRYACHLLTHLPGGETNIKILDKSLKEIDSQKKFCIDVNNTGTTFLNPTMTVKLYNQQGQLEKTLKAPGERLYPQNPQRYFLDGEGLQGKQWNAFLVLDNGKNQLFFDKFSLHFP